ncbi:MAG: hypothetical protein GY757_35650 [bacterium]|nr:hypothetical protein [bacterium]
MCAGNGLENKKKITPMENPYDPYDFKSGRSYYNKAVVEELKKEFEAPSPQKIIFIQGKEGSGKSSTLNRIKSDSDILGSKYVSIYIDLNRVLPDCGNNFLFKLYENLKESIDRYRFPTFSDPLDTLKVNVTFENLRNFFTAIEAQIQEKQSKEKKSKDNKGNDNKGNDSKDKDNKDKDYKDNKGKDNKDKDYKDKQSIILIIFDDFDKVFETGNTERFYPVLSFFKALCLKKDNFRIILCGSGELPDAVKHSDMGLCLKNMLRVKMQIIAPVEFNKLIEVPAKGKITYSPDALLEIQKHTGGNLYCQQFLCHYIFDLLSNKEKYSCDVGDVSAAANAMIGDTREDFEHFWGRLDYENQLVCSALVDENIVSRRGQYYFIEPASLLEELFEPGLLFEILNRLHLNEFIYKPNGRRFDEFPFKIPLFGNWIALKHPFFKTVVENVEPIANKRDFVSLGRVVEKIPGLFFPQNLENVIDGIRLWFGIHNSLEEQGRVDRVKTGLLAKKMCQILGLSLKEENLHLTDCYLVDFEKLNIGSITKAFFLIQDRLEPSQTDIQHFIDNILKDVNSTKPCLFFCFKKTEKILELEKKAYLNVILVEGKDLKDILFSSRPLQVLKELLLKRISSSQISPYQTEGPAVTTFYGRHSELQRVMGSANKSFIIVGARRIGKSSLIMRVKKELDDLGYHSVYMDLEFPPNPDYGTFLSSFRMELQRCFKRDFDFENSLEKFVADMKTIDPPRKRLIVILDEIDELLRFDSQNDYQLLRAFRRLFHERCCQFIISGFEVLYNSKRERTSPLYNFGEEKALGPLERQYALDLITEPMANIGIEYADPQDRELILDYTACHPNLLQFFCKNLIDKIAVKSENRRTISRSDIRELFNLEYDSYILNDFYMFYDDLDNLEKLFILILLASGTKEEDFSIRRLNRLLKEKGIILHEVKLHRTIQKLVLRFIFLNKGQGKYAFALSHFPAILEKREDPDLLESLIQRVQEGDYGQSL